jgi:hypothetical protein
MIAAIAAAVSAASISRLVSGLAGLSGKLALVEDTGPVDDAGLGTGAGACTAGPIKATGWANADGEVIAATGALLAGAFWRPTE